MNNYAFIFARGGSKGLPGKNIKLLHNKPLIQYAIDVAKSCSQITKIFVSTDDHAIAAVASQEHVEVINRPARLAEDDAPEWQAWLHAISLVESKYGFFDAFISLPATSPLRHLNDVDNAIDKFQKTGADVCLGITPASRSPFFNMVKTNDDGLLVLADERGGNYARRQDVPEVFDLTTVVYVLKPDFIKSASNLFEGKVTGVIIPKERAVDIDDNVDFLLAKSILDNLELLDEY